MDYSLHVKIYIFHFVIISCILTPISDGHFFKKMVINGYFMTDHII